MTWQRAYRGQHAVLPRMAMSAGRMRGTALHLIHYQCLDVGDPHHLTLPSVRGLHRQVISCAGINGARARNMERA